MTTEECEWREVVGFEGFYEVSNTGSVRSLARIVPVRGSKRQQRVPARILRRRGRQQFCLALHGQRHMRSLSRLMDDAGFPARPGRK